MIGLDQAYGKAVSPDSQGYMTLTAQTKRLLSIVKIAVFFGKGPVI